MKSIGRLTDIGIGKQVIIIGGGTSVGEIDFSRVPDDMMRICINDALPWRVLPQFAKHPLETYDTKIDMLMYNDLCAAAVIKRIDRRGIPMISYNGYQIPGVEYTYRQNDFRAIKVNIATSYNTGLKALAFAKRLMKFDEIYLMGFDFYCDGVNGARVSHFYGDSVGKEGKHANEYNRDHHFKRLEAMMKQFVNLPDTDGIYNCNAASRLKRYPHKLPY